MEVLGRSGGGAGAPPRTRSLQPESPRGLSDLLVGIVPCILSLIPAIAIGPVIFIFGLMICEECTKHIKQRHHSAIFFGIFFGVADYIYTAFQPSATNNGINAMSKGSALSSMLWVSIIVYTTDRRWIRAAIFSTSKCYECCS